MTSGGEATRIRILEAARADFAQHGLAGARVDRIAASARANKAQLYAYFGNKGELFDVVFEQSLEDIVDAVPLDATDLPGYAVRLYDEYLRHPELVRMATWSRLEFKPSGRLIPMSADKKNVEDIAAAQAAGLIDPSLDPFDVYSTVIALSLTWSPASVTFTAVPTDPEADHDRRRATLRTLVERAYPPQPTD